MADVDIRRAETAALLLRDEIFDKIVTDAEREYLDRALACDVKDDLGRYRYLEAIKVVRAVSGHLQQHVENGKIDARKLDELNRKPRLW